MRICNIFTGGTIGSTLDNDGYISTSKEAPYQLLYTYMHKYKCTCDMVNCKPYTILSENLDAHHLLKLIKTVASNLDSNFDGIIIMHGTDTLQYTAAMLSIIFNNIQTPIILVSSDYILSDPRANGIVNYHFALRFIETYHKDNTVYGTHNVFVSYENKGGLSTIHCADMLQPPIPYSADVKSILDNYVGTYTIEGKENYIPNMNFNPQLSIQKNMETVSNNLFKLPQCIVNRDYIHIQLDFFASYIMRIQPFPGLTFPDIISNTKVIILETYHSGTFFINDSFYQFVKKASNAHIPILLTGLNSQENCYETVKQYTKANIIPVYDTAVIALYCFIWLVLSNQ